MKKVSLRFITTSAIIAALYAALTIVLSGLSYGQVQFRVSEILTVLPYFTPAAIPGLFIGCILGNLTSPFGPIDIITGSLASLLAAFLSRKMPKRWLVPLPPVICNGIIVGTELHFIANLPLIATMLYVALGEAVICYGLGYPFLLVLEKYKLKLFK